jgi:hypothetical protein
MPKVHFQNYRISEAGDDIIPGYLCNRSVDACDDANTSPLRHEVTCGFCLKLLMATKREDA